MKNDPTINRPVFEQTAKITKGFTLTVAIASTFAALVFGAFVGCTMVWSNLGSLWGWFSIPALGTIAVALFIRTLNLIKFGGRVFDAMFSTVLGYGIVLLFTRIAIFLGQTVTKTTMNMTFGWIAFAGALVMLLVLFFRISYEYSQGD